MAPLVERHALRHIVASLTSFSEMLLLPLLSIVNAYVEMQVSRRRKRSYQRSLSFVMTIDCPLTSDRYPFFVNPYVTCCVFDNFFRRQKSDICGFNHGWLNECEEFLAKTAPGSTKIRCALVFFFLFIPLLM
jgi:hypothetical protein